VRLSGKLKVMWRLFSTLLSFYRSTVTKCIRKLL